MSAGGIYKVIISCLRGTAGGYLIATGVMYGVSLGNYAIEI